MRLATQLPGTEPVSAAGRRRRTLRLLLLCGDAVAALLCVEVVRALGESSTLSAALACAFAVALWSLLGLNRPRFALSIVEDVPRMLVGVAGGVGAAAIGTPLTLSSALRVALTLLLLSMVIRWPLYSQVRRLRRGGTALTTPAVLLGDGRLMDDFRRRLEAQSHSGMRVAGVASARELNDGDLAPDYLLVRSPTGQPVGYLGDMRGGALVVVGSGVAESGHLKSVLRACHARGVETWLVSALEEMAPLQRGDDRLAGLPVLRVSAGYQRRVSVAVKRGFDVVASAAAILALSPVLLAVAAAVRLELGRGVLFRQERVGRHGELFTVLKFRSMPHADQPRTWGSAAGDMSIGPVGRFIRRFSLDELPQLINILRGDMSVVGPRPEQPAYVAEFTERFPGYGLRHRVSVGLTGLAAVEGLRGNTSLRDRVHYDNLYIENWSIWLDLKILARTVVTVVTGSGE